MSEAETLSAGEPLPIRRGGGSGRPPGLLPVIGILLGVLVGALLGALGTLAVVHAQQPDKAAAFLTEQRLAAYRAYAEQVASTNDVVDQALATVQQQAVDDEGSPADPTGATLRALDLARSRLNDRTRDVDILASPPVRKAYDANHRAQDDVLQATRALFADGAVASPDDADVVETKVLAVRQQQPPSTLVTVVSEELAAGS